MMNFQPTRIPAALAAACALGLAAPAFAAMGGMGDPLGAFGHPDSQTRLRANLTDASNTSGHGEVMWVTDARNNVVMFTAGVSLPVGSSAYGLVDSNAAAAAGVTMTITHVATPSNVTYTCSLHISDMVFLAPVAPSTAYTERADYELAVSQLNGAAAGRSFGSCASFPTKLTSGDTVSVAIGSNTLTGTLK